MTYHQTFSIRPAAAALLLGLAAIAASPGHAADTAGGGAGTAGTAGTPMKSDATSASPAARQQAKPARAARKARDPASVVDPQAEAPSPGKKPPRSIQSRSSPGFMDDGARKREGSPAR